ncbi:phosphoglycerate mutase-like protein [Auriculariales sp. MPI-PUGE-AT-0066]|nr:phosphoglycerate mutase-like protein [Auriculariales sp. MPI-PUGE-AT-0066]
MPLRVLIVRHGETIGNTKKLIQGQSNGPETWLNEVGRKQAALCRDGLQSVSINLAFSSDLKRAAQTAEIILEPHHKVPLELVEALREGHMGEIQGLVYHPDLYNPYPPSAETVDSMKARVKSYWESSIVPLAQRPDTADVTVLLVSHAGVLSALLIAFQDLGYPFPGGWPEDTHDLNSRIPHMLNTSITTVEVQADGTGEIVRFADVSHMK